MPDDQNIKRMESKLDEVIALGNATNVSVQLLVHGLEEQRSVFKESRAETKRDIKDISRRLRDVELFQEGNKDAFTDFKTVKTSIIRWVIGSILTFASIATAAIALVVKLNG